MLFPLDSKFPEDWDFILMITASTVTRHCLAQNRYMISI